MTDEKIQKLIAQVEEMIETQENDNLGEKSVDDILHTIAVVSGMKQVLAVIRLYEE